MTRPILQVTVGNEEPGCVEDPSHAYLPPAPWWTSSLRCTPRSRRLPPPPPCPSPGRHCQCPAHRAVVPAHRHSGQITARWTVVRLLLDTDIQYIGKSTIRTQTHWSDCTQNTQMVNTLVSLQTGHRQMVNTLVRL